MTRAVIVTGASSGIGEAVSRALAARGLVVYAGVRTENDARRLQSIQRIAPLMLDVTDSGALAAAARRVREDGYAVTGLVNNAGIAIGGPVEAVPIPQWRRQFDVNFFGAIAATQAFLPLLRANRGRIVFVGSVSGRIAFPYAAPYCASKFALRALADALRTELAPSGVPVTLVELGSVKTPVWQKARAMRDEIHAWLSPQMPGHYRDAVTTIVRGLEREERHSMPVEKAANAVVNALTGRRPRAHQIVGGAAAAAAMLPLLPAALQDRLLRVTMRLR
jgi:NAD(P)-dependent dehydrogenase (short-subunit alcohol dehydrogenase family)